MKKKTVIHPTVSGFLLILPATLILSGAQHITADEIGFIEKFALASDREAILRELIPGTEDYYYFHCLHYQNTEQFEKAEKMLDKWIRRHDYNYRAGQNLNARAREIVNRQMLLTYSQDPAKTLSYLQRHMKINLSHQRESLEGPALPSRLDPALISRKALTERALARHTGIRGFEPSALAWLLDEKLSDADEYDALKNLKLPDHPQLAEKLNKYLSNDTREFGQLGIHRLLTRQQLLHLANLKPRLMNNPNFINTYLSRIRPNPDVHFPSDLAAQKDHLEELWDFAKRLQPAYNSLKANVLYHRLVYDRSVGIYDRDRFLEYIRIPREARYIEPKYHRQKQFQNYKVNFGQDYRKQTLYSSIGNDEPLIRSYLHQFFVTDQDYKSFEEYLHGPYLRKHFAETKIVNGLGDIEKWESYLSATEYRDLRNRVDLDFVPTSRQYYGSDDPVSVEINVKNIRKLIVKVFEINTGNYYRDLGREIDTNIELDGLQPNREYTFEYDESPFRRNKREFKFPEMDKRGVYVVDFIGNRKSSRALVRKGRLRYIEEVTPAGHQLTIVDERNQPVKGATVTMPGARYTADKEGFVMIPFSNRPGRVPVVISQGNFSSFDFLAHQAESYSLKAGFFVDRESLVSGQEATVAIRPQLLVNGIPASVALLENSRLLISSTDLEGAVSTREVKDFKLYEDRESEFRFKVPQRLQGLTFQLSGTLKNMSQNRETSLSASDTFLVNTIDADVKVADLFLSKIDGQYYVDLLGKTGELRAARPVQFSIKHRDFRDPVQLSLQTGMKGRIQLGALEGIASLTVTGSGGTSRTWNLNRSNNTYYSSCHAAEGETILVPLAAMDRKLSHQDVALLEMRGGVFVNNHLQKVRLENGMLHIEGLKRGDYRLVLKNIKTIGIKIARGAKIGRFAVNRYRQLELKPSPPLQITAVDRNREKTMIRVANADRFTRIHVVATRYVPKFDLFQQLSLQDAEPGLTMLPQSQSLYVAGRKIGDEYQYILDRKYAEKYPGVMLRRPSLLLQPWAVRSTQTTRQAPSSGTRFDGLDRSSGSAKSLQEGSQQRQGPKSDPSNLDFLGEGSVVLLNLELDEKGQLEIGNELFRGRQHLHICVSGPGSTAFRDIAFGETPLAPEDLRLVLGLDPEKRYARKKEITFVDRGKSFEITDIATGEFELYDNLPGVYRLFSSLSGDPKLAEFRFVVDWTQKSMKEKLELYSRYACHELNYFLCKKDPDFFKTIVLPYLVNKKDRTFLDEWFLGEDLREYLHPWAYGELNTVERILLAQSIDSESEYTSRQIRESYFLNPTGQNRFDSLFGFALQGNSLETGTGVISGRLSKMKREQQAIAEKAFFGRDQAGQAAAPGAFAQDAQNAIANAGDMGGGGFAGKQLAKSQTRGGRTRLSPTRNSPNTEADEALDLENAKVMEESRQAGQSNDVAKKLPLSRRSNNGKESERFYKNYADKRGRVSQLFRQVDQTREWAENNYYKLTIDQQTAGLVQVNRFWRDYAQHPAGTPFHSVNVAEASRNFTEMMFALSVLDLDWKPGKHDTRQEGNQLILTADSPLVIYHDQIRPARDGRKETSVLVSQNFFNVNDRYRYEGPDRLDKFVTDEFIKRTAYGCQVVVTNPTSAKQKIDLLLQIPRGAMPLKKTRQTRSVHLELEPYRTSSTEYYFYFPESGEFEHYPVHVARKEEVIAFAEPMKFRVVDQPSKVDKTSWAYISQYGSGQDVLDYLKENNLQQTETSRIAWRMNDQKFFRQVISYLDRHHEFDATLWGYAIKHDVPDVIRQLLTVDEKFVNQTGPYIDTRLLTNDRVARRTYEHLEYDPLINARVHQLGSKRQILNNRFHSQYHRLLWILGCKKELNDADQLALSYYLLLQDRVTEAKAYFSRVSKNRIPSQLQYDYLTAYLDLFNDTPTLARKISAQYRDYRVQRWRNAFAEIGNLLDEIDGKATRFVDDGNRENVQDRRAASTASFDFKVDNRQVEINFQNLDRVQVNYYVMDVELLFSRNPFVQQYSGELTYIRPRKSEWVELPKGTRHQWKLPAELDRSNVLIEISGGETTKSQAYYSHAMNVQMIESFGQLKVVDAKSGQRVPATYCKVYAKLKDGKTQFYKDGYTDLRGRFDYTSLSTNDLDNVEKFSVLVMNEKLGATVREVSPPKR
ncbi:MAG: hypothetical protein VX768_07395 [Planctomycetota bacterium]|nr:hypothetical protein [Planctomycetota bacterium]